MASAGVFIELRMPTRASWGMKAAPQFNVEVVKKGSGGAGRYTRWLLGPLWKAEGSTWSLVPADAAAMFSFLMAVGQGRLNGFRVKVPHDCVATTAPFGLGDGATTVFTLEKAYTFNGDAISTFGSQTAARLIQKPNRDTPFGLVGAYPKIFKNGTPLVETTDYTIDLNTGKVTFAVAPAGGSSPDQLTWTGSFDTPMAFLDDYMPGTFTNPSRMDFDFSLEEVRLKADGTLA